MQSRRALILESRTWSLNYFILFFKHSSNVHLQSVVMTHVLREENPDYWNNGNLAKCFVDCTFNLYNALQKKILRDIFYPEVIE